ncbi:MAG: PKD domain-containing protein, partial [Planctomycetes bacterium]|nr:PKD domain-containing protein [Planctomycetota bacterium]
YNDRGPRLTRCENGAFTDLGNSRMGLEADAPAEPPLEWRVEVDGDHIRVYGDDVLYIDAIDATYRGGFFGFWAWAGGQEVRIDNFNVEGVALTPCFTSTPRLPQAGKPIAFDAGCSEVFLGGQTITSYSWSFGDGSTATGATASHTYDFPDSYTVTLTVEDSGGGSESLERVITASEDLIPLADCFERPAGDVDGWTVQQGIWSITDEGKLATNTADAVEHWLWAGDPPAVMAGDFVLEYDLEFFAEPADGVGRHGGVMFFAQAPTTRGQTSGYTVWWIDRVEDFGIVLARRDNGALTQLQAGTGDAILDPPLTWRIEVEGPTIRILGDGVEYVSVEDDTYREGYFGLWQYSNGQDVLYDNIRMGVTTLPECGEEPVTRFVRGDPDSSGVINITDGIRILSYLFTGGAALECDDAGDTDDDGLLTITDAIKVFGYLFLGQGEPAAPAPSDATYLPADCAADPTPGDPLDCGKMSDTCK